MDRKKIQELSQELFEYAYTIDANLNSWSEEQLINCLEEVQELATALQEEAGNSTTITYLGLKPTTASAVAYSLLEVKE